MGLDTRLSLARLLFVTDARANSDELGRLAEQVVAGGADIIELTAPTLSTKKHLAALNLLRSKAQRAQRIVAVHGDAELAGEFGADMLVLPDDGSSAAQARRRLPKASLVVRSCRSHDDIEAALADEAVDALIVSADLGTVRFAAEHAPAGDPAAKPWFAAGGITVDYLDDLAEAGCRRVVVSRAISKAGDPQAVTRAFATALRKIWDADSAMERVTLGAFKGYGRNTGALGTLNVPTAPAGGPTMDDPGTGPSAL